MKPILVLVATALIASGCSWNTYQYLASGVDERCFDVEKINRNNFTYLADAGVANYPRKAKKDEKEVSRICTINKKCETCEEETKCTVKYSPMPTKGECLAQMASIRKNTPLVPDPLLFESWATVITTLTSIPIIGPWLGVGQ